MNRTTKERTPGENLMVVIHSVKFPNAKNVVPPAILQSNYNQALVNESLELSLKSAKSLENEDRMTAIAQALEALPSGQTVRCFRARELAEGGLSHA